VTLTPRSCDCDEVSYADTAAGCAGVPHARKFVLEALTALAPAAFVAVAVQEYVPRAVRPETLTVAVALVPLRETPPVEDVQVELYAVTVEPLMDPTLTLTSTHDVAVPTV
jgi:hypothetical protein